MSVVLAEASKLKRQGEPIIAAACHCRDCSEGSRRLEALPTAQPILDSYGGTPYLLYRRDRVNCKKGGEFLKSIKVEENSSKRVFTSGCNSYMYLDLNRRMHWVPIFRGQFHGEAPAIEMRINAKFGPGTENVRSDVPFFSSLPFKFVRKLLAAKLAMIFHR